jgi:hypothetical protein
MIAGRSAELLRIREAWRDYCLTVGTCAAVAVGAAAVLRLTGLNPLPFTQLIGLRTAFTFFVWLYLAVILARVGTRAEVIGISTIPFVAQFYQVALGRDFAQGPGLVRLAPYLVMALAMAVAVCLRRWRPRLNEALVFGAIWVVALVGLLRGLHLTTAGLPVVFLVGVLLPLFYAYVEALARSAPHRLHELLLGVTVGTFLLMFGFFVTVQLGQGVETALGFGSLDSAMNAADFNSVAGYLLLLWPFALAFSARRSRLLVAGLLVLLLATVFAGLSKTMLILTPPLVLVSIPACFPRLALRHAVVFVLTLGVSASLGLWSLDRLGLTSNTLSRWEQRLDLEVPGVASITMADLVRSVGVGSQAQEDRAIVRQQGWAMFQGNPLVGQGWATFPYFSQVGHTSAHSLSIDVLSQVGLIGAVLLWGLILLVVGRLAAVAAHRRRLRLVIVFAAAFLLWLIAAHTLGAQIFVVAEEGVTSGAINGVVLVLYLSRRVLNHALLDPAAPQ